MNYARSFYCRFAVAAAFASLLGPSAWAADPCVVTRIALDIGSGSSKLASAVVNRCEQRILAKVLTAKTAIGFKDHLSRERSDGGFEPAFLEQAARKIKEMLVKAQADTASKLATDPALAGYAYLATRPIAVSGICTEAFRQAHNTGDFIQAMASSADGQPSVRVKVISQELEGKLAFTSAMAELGTDPSADVDPARMISWDIGGGSLQIVGYQAGKWQVYGNRLASNPMRSFVLNEIQHKEVMQSVPNDKDPTLPELQPISPNPLLSGPDCGYEREMILGVTQAFVDRQLEDLVRDGWLSKRLASGQAAPTVYGVGALHGALLDLVRQLPGRAENKGYTRDDLAELLEQVLLATDAELIGKWRVDAPFAKGSATNVLLVYEIMSALDIPHVRVVKTDNALGVMISPQHWAK